MRRIVVDVVVGGNEVREGARSIHAGDRLGALEVLGVSYGSRPSYGQALELEVGLHGATPEAGLDLVDALSTTLELLKSELGVRGLYPVLEISSTTRLR